MEPGAIAGADDAGTTTRIALRPHDPTTGKAIEKSEIVKGYEYDRGQFVTFTADELKALDIESSKVVDLEMLVPCGDIDPVYLDGSYYLYPDGAISVVPSSCFLFRSLRVCNVRPDETEVRAVSMACRNHCGFPQVKIVCQHIRGIPFECFSTRRPASSSALAGLRNV
jgi:hypothetical protein